MVNDVDTTHLIQAIKEEQDRLNISDSILCTNIGVSRTYWYLLKVGSRGVGVGFLKGICRSLPGLQSEVLSFLRGNHSNEH